MLEEQVFEDKLSGFTDCYWSIPQEALAEVKAAGYTVLTYAGAESFLGGMSETLEKVKEANAIRYSRIVQIAATMAELPQYRDSTDHLIIVARND